MSVVSFPADPFMVVGPAHTYPAACINEILTQDDALQFLAPVVVDAKNAKPIWQRSGKMHHVHPSQVSHSVYGHAWLFHPGSLAMIDANHGARSEPQEFQSAMVAWMGAQL